MKTPGRAVRRRSVLAGITGALVAPAIVSAQGIYPNRPVRYINPYPAGGPTDTLSRMFCAKMSELTGQQWIVENRGGAGGNVGMDALAKSDPDGYSLGLGGIAAHAIAPTLYGKLPFNARTDFTFVSTIWWLPNLLAVNLDLPVKSVAELIELCRKNPGKYSYGSAGSGSITHLAGELLKLRTGIDIIHVPYKGSGPAVADFIGGQVNAAFFVPGNILEFAKDGRARLIASTGQKRMEATPDVPTMIEQGYPDFVAVTWIGFLAPGGTPRPIIDRYNKEIVRILHEPDVRAKLDQMQMDRVAGTPEQFSQWIRTEITRCGKVIKDTGARAD